MLRRTIALLALAAVSLPHGARAQDREWEEDYTNEWRDEGPPRGDYETSVDLNDQGAVSMDTFEGSLSPYGEWVSTGPYGRVWRPHVAAGWRPYYYGRWEWTNEGWLWVSDEPWGWAAYHYGRWTFDSYYGWVWVPGYQWAPAWVAWRYSGDVVGWAPLGPGVSVYVSTYPFVDFWWTFVPTARFVAVPVYSVAYAPTYARQYFYSTAPAPPRPVPSRAVVGGRPAPAPAWGGPAPRVIEQRIGRPVTPVRVVPAPAPGAARPVGPGEVAIYRPGRPAPSRSGEARGGRAYAPSPGRSESAARPAPSRESGAAAAPSREAPGRSSPGAPPGREAPGRGSGAAPAPPASRGGEHDGDQQGRERRAPGAPSSRYDGYGAPGTPPARGYAPPYASERSVRSDGAPRGGYAPPSSSRGGYAPPSGGYAPPSGGYAPPSSSRGGYAPPAASHGGGYAAPAPRGGGASAPARSEGHGGGARPAPAARERDHR